MKKKVYLWGLGILVLAAVAMLLSLEENLEDELKYVAKQTTELPATKEVSYLKMPLSEQDKQNIYELFDPLANWSLISLGMNRSEIEKRGKATKNIPILRYLAYVRLTPEIQQLAQKIRRRSKIWKPFQKGFVRGLEVANETGEVRPYLASLAKDLGVDAQLLRSLADSNDWSRFLNTVLFSN